MEIPEDRDQPDVFEVLPRLARLRAMLARLPRSHQLAFAACCCERLHSDYAALVAAAGEPDALRPIIDRLWRHAADPGLPTDEIEELSKSCSAIDPGDDESRPYFWEAASAAGAAFLALRALQGDTASNVAKVSECAREKVDQVLWEKYSSLPGLGIYPHEMEAINKIIDDDPLMIEEEKKQTGLLRFLLEREHLTREDILELRNQQY